MTEEDRKMFARMERIVNILEHKVDGLEQNMNALIDSLEVDEEMDFPNYLDS